MSSNNIFTCTNIYISFRRENILLKWENWHFSKIIASHGSNGLFHPNQRMYSQVNALLASNK